MSVIKPPITGDAILDSWTQQITRELNSGSGGTGAGGTSQANVGASGFNTATIYLYARTSSDSAPSAMNEETTYTYKTGVLVNGDSHDGVSNGLGPNDAWFRDVPSGAGGYLWVTTVHVADTGAVETIASGSWSTVTKLAEKGEQGKFAVELYKRSSSTPSAPTDVTWTYATSAITGNNSASWALAVPSGTDQVWISSAIFDPSTGATNITSWGTPFQGGTTGPAGAAGTNNATVAIYQKNTSASSAPANPSGTFTYTFSTGVLSVGTFNSWSQTIPTLAKGEYLWMKHATASSTTNTDSIPASEFSTAAVTGASGIDGNSVAVVELFQVSTSNSSAPADPIGTFTYTFSNNTLSSGTLNGWSQSIPTVPAGQYLWVIQASAVSDTNTDSIPASEFSSAIVVSAAGAAGSDSIAVKLTSSKYVIAYDENGLNPSPSSITLTATASNVTNGFFKFTGDEISDESSFTDGSSALSDTFSVSVPAAFADWTNPSTLRVGVSEADQNELAFDTISIPAIQQGADGYTVVVTNESHTLPASSTGVVSSYSGSGTTISVFKGATQLTGITSGTPSASQFTVTVANNSDITEGSQSASSNNIVIADHSGMSNSVDSLKIDYTITVRPANSNLTFLKSQTLTKSKIGATGATGSQGPAGPDGSDGSDGSDGATGPRQTVGRVYRTATDANAPTAPTNSNSTFSFSSNAFTTLPSGWSETPPTPNTSDSNPYWQCTFSAVEASAGGTVTETFGSPVKVIEFDGIVKFTNSNTLSDGSTSIVPPKVFRQTGTPTAVSSGDLWIDTDDNNKLYVASGSGTSNWVLSQDSTAASALATAAQNTANSKIATFRQDNVPTALAAGDIWVDTNDGNKMYIALAAGADQVAANEWVTVQDAAIATAQSAADSKAKVFRQASTPTALAAGDVWIDTDDNNEMYIASGAGTGNWVREDFANLINGNTTTIDGGKITAGSIQAAQIDANAITAAKLDANAITGKNILIGDLAVNTSTGAVTSGEGFKAIGTGTGAGVVAMGDATTNITVHPSSGLLTLNGDVVGTANINASAITEYSLAELSSITSISGSGQSTVLTCTLSNVDTSSKILILTNGGLDPGFTGEQGGSNTNRCAAVIKFNGTTLSTQIKQGDNASGDNFQEFNFTAVKDAASGTNTVLLIGDNVDGNPSVASRFNAGSGLYVAVIKK